MGLMDFIWPFGLLAGGAMFVFGLIALIFWIWMLIDCARRRFRNGVEKIVWILVLVFTGLIGAIIYLVVIRLSNHGGLAKR